MMVMRYLLVLCRPSQVRLLFFIQMMSGINRSPPPLIMAVLPVLLVLEIVLLMLGILRSCIFHVLLMTRLGLMRRIVLFRV
nr:MAG: hypothetical protein [Crogonang virus 171]